MRDSGTWLEWGNRFRAHVRDRKIPWADIAERMKVTEAGIRHWLNGTRDINLADFFALCGAVDADPVRVLFGRPLVSQKLQDALEEERQGVMATQPARTPVKARRVAA